jgi:hypothetical protein
MTPKPELVLELEPARQRGTIKLPWPKSEGAANEGEGIGLHFDDHRAARYVERLLRAGLEADERAILARSDPDAPTISENDYRSMLEGLERSAKPYGLHVTVDGKGGVHLSPHDGVPLEQAKARIERYVARGGVQRELLWQWITDENENHDGALHHDSVLGHYYSATDGAIPEEAMFRLVDRLTKP